MYSNPVFYAIFIVPFLNFYLTYDGGIKNAIVILVETYFLGFVIFNAARFGIILLVLFANFSVLQTEPMYEFSEKFSNCCQKTTENLIKYIEKGHKMYLFHLNAFIQVNRYGIRSFLTTFLLVLFYFSVANSAVMFIGKYDTSTYPWILCFIVLIQAIGFMAVMTVISLSDSLTCFTPHLSSSLSILSKRRARIGISKYFKLLQFYEIVLHRKPFRFKFGPFGRMSKKSFFSFILVYAAELLTIALHFIKKNETLILH